MSKITITPLGTVSPYCKDNMNCPGFLLEYKNHKILLDCGNGITKLLNFPTDLYNLSVIITHYHNDHFADIGAIQYASFVYHNLGILDNKINILLPSNDINNIKYSIISNMESYTNYIEINNNDVYKFDDLNITFKDNRSHSIESFMIKIKNNKHKIVYTSDIGVSNLKSVIDFCINADLLICESSLLNKHNKSKGHLTASEAGFIAKQCYAKKLILTHFWPEEDKKLYLEEAKKEFDNTIVAKEGKRLVLK